MLEGSKFYLCKHCGNLFGAIHNSGVPVFCCGEKMVQLTVNTTEAAHEKHLPVVTQNGNHLSVSVGSVEHPMTEEHHIEWVYVQTDCGGHRKALKAGDAPKAEFCMTADEKPIAVFAYCNLHGLWAVEL